MERSNGTLEKGGTLLGALLVLGTQTDGRENRDLEADVAAALSYTNAAVVKFCDPKKEFATKDSDSPFHTTVEGEPTTDEKVADSKAAETLANLKQAHPEIAKAGLDEAIISAIKALGEGFDEFFKQFGYPGLLFMASLAAAGMYVAKNPGQKDPSETDPKLEAELAPQLEEAEAIAKELDTLGANPSESDLQRISERAGILMASLAVILAPAIAEAGFREAWDGLEEAYEATTTGTGEFLKLIALIIQMCIMLLKIGITSALVIATTFFTAKNWKYLPKAWKFITQAKTKLLDDAVGPRVPVRTKWGMITLDSKVGMATELEEARAAHPAHPGAIDVARIGTELRTAVSGVRDGRSLSSRLMEGEADADSFKRQLDELRPTSDRILGILRDHDANPALPFPQNEFNALIESFRAMTTRLNGNVAIVPQNRRHFGPRDGAMITGLIVSAFATLMWLSFQIGGPATSPRQAEKNAEKAAEVQKAAEEAQEEAKKEAERQKRMQEARDADAARKKAEADAAEKQRKGEKVIEKKPDIQAAPGVEPPNQSLPEAEQYNEPLKPFHEE